MIGDVTLLRLSGVSIASRWRHTHNNNKFIKEADLSLHDTFHIVAYSGLSRTVHNVENVWAYACLWQKCFLPLESIFSLPMTAGEML